MTKTEIKRYLVGGAVRDLLLGEKPSDVDYTVEAPSFEAMEAWLVEKGHTIFLSTPEFGTIRSRLGKEAADHVLARKEGPYTDGRHPDWVEVGTLEDDLKRRDFTVNAMAIDDESNELIDLFGGVRDLTNKRLRAVGDPRDRLREDPLRAFRAMRFAVTKDMTIDRDLDYAMKLVFVLDRLHSVSTDRIRVELGKMFAFDGVASMKILLNSYPAYLNVVVGRGIWFKPTTEGRQGWSNHI